MSRQRREAGRGAEKPAAQVPPVGVRATGHPPGAVVTREGTIALNDGRERVELEVSNTGDRPVQVGSHFHFFEVNRALRFDRAKAFGFRLDVPAGTAVRFEPGERKRVRLVALAGMRRVGGLNRLTEGSLDSVHVRRAALRRAAELGFLGGDGTGAGPAEDTPAASTAGGEPAAGEGPAGEGLTAGKEG